MAMDLRTPLLLLPAILLASFGAAQPDAVEAIWSSNTYGPDGPWQAVNVKIGSNNQSIDLYPGSLLNYQVLGATSCDNIPPGETCFPLRAGLYNPNASVTAKRADGPFIQGVSWMTPINTTNLTETAIYHDQVYLGYINEAKPLTPMTVWDEGTSMVILPNGTQYPPQVGLLALGGPSLDPTSGHPIVDPIGHNPATQLFLRNVTPSASFGLHIGSVEPSIAPSLLFGGYDQSRVLKPVSSQQYLLYGQGTTGHGPVKLQIDLIDVGLGVAENRGASPFSAPSISGLLAANNDTITNGVFSRVVGDTPYIHLPRNTCDAIAAELPVTYNEDLGIYLWNVTDPDYERIVTSPSFLSFTFRPNEQGDFTIKVPFRLLNLTLSPPLMPEPTPYFPCAPLDSEVYVLGRAFLQAAFWGVNWDPNNPPGTWFLAQAPGPNTALIPKITRMFPGDTTIDSDNGDWESSWDNYWTPLPLPTSTPNSGLSTGAKAGIGVGVVLGVLLLIGIVLFFFIRKRRQSMRRKMSAETKPDTAVSKASEARLNEDQTEPPSDSDGDTLTAASPSEGKTEMHEMSANRNSRLEMDATKDARAEMADNPARQEVDAGPGGRGPVLGSTLNPAEVGSGDEEYVRYEMPTSRNRTPSPSAMARNEKREVPPTDIEKSISQLQDENGSTSATRENAEQTAPSGPVNLQEKRGLLRKYNGAG